MQRSQFADMLVRYFGFDAAVAKNMSERITPENYQDAVSKLVDLRNRLRNDLTIHDRSAYTYRVLDNLFRGIQNQQTHFFINYIFMNSRTSDWFETKIKYEKTAEDGALKPVIEQYVVDALSFTEAEATIIEEMSSYISGEFKIVSMKPAPYHEIFFSEDPKADKWYKAKLSFITIDEKTEKEKRSMVNYLVQAATLPGAVNAIGNVMGGTMIDYVISSVTETMFMDVFEHKSNSKTNQKDDMPEYNKAD